MNKRFPPGVPGAETDSRHYMQDALPISVPGLGEALSPELLRPNFSARVAELENIAEQEHGAAMRCGVEAEIAFYEPAGVRRGMASEDMRPHTKQTEMAKIRNPEVISGEAVSGDAELAILADFREEARSFVNDLLPKNEVEARRKETWLSQIDDFGIRELINFRIYKEFSRPTLAKVSPPEEASLAELDAYSEETGWLEFRFGTGKYQSGYYDNDKVTEIRLSPCAPSEAVRREAIILGRMTEIASEYGYVFSLLGEHINLSVYEPDVSGAMLPVIGQTDEHRPRTLDIAAGISAAFQEGIWLTRDEMGYDFNFGRHSQVKLAMGPTRKLVRLMNGRIELRNRFEAVDQGLTWLMAGAIYGISRGHAAIQAEGFTVPREERIFRAHNGSGYDKDRDVHITRAFEHVIQNADGGFDLDLGFNIVRGDEIRKALLGDDSEDYGRDSLNNIVFLAARVGDDGVPQVTAERLQAAYDIQSDFLKDNYLKKFAAADMEELARRLNERLGTVRLEAVTAILGESQFSRADRKSAIEAFDTSDMAQLAYGDQLGTLGAWLASAEPEKVMALLRS